MVTARHVSTPQQVAEMHVDLEAVSAGQFARLVRRLEDEQLLAVVRMAGVDVVLARVLNEMAARYRGPTRVNASVKFRITDGDGVHRGVLVMREGTCEIVEAADAGLTVSTDVVTFLRLLTSTKPPTDELLRRKLKLRGNPLLVGALILLFDTAPRRSVLAVLQRAKGPRRRR